MHEAKNTRKKRQKQKLPAEKITDEKRRSKQISEAKKSAAKNARSKNIARRDTNASCEKHQKQKKPEPKYVIDHTTLKTRFILTNWFFLTFPATSLLTLLLTFFLFLEEKMNTIYLGSKCKGRHYIAYRTESFHGLFPVDVLIDRFHEINIWTDFWLQRRWKTGY